MLKLGIFGDSGDALNDGTPFYYSPGQYEGRLGSGGPFQQAVARMMRSWGISDLINLGDASYSANASTLLDYNIGQFYNDFMAPYGNQPDALAFADPNSIYSVKSLGGTQAIAGKQQWPYNYYNFPFGFPNPVTNGAGGSPDGKNHFWLTPGNHDLGTILANYSDINVNQIDRKNIYIDPPSGPDAFDYAQNINTNPQPPDNGNFKEVKPKDGSSDPAYWQATSKTGSTQQVLDYLPYLKTTADTTPSYLKSGQVHVGRANPDGYGIWYSVDLGETVENGVTVPLVHVQILDTNRLMTDAGYYDFNLSRDLYKNSGLKPSDYTFDPINSKAKNAWFQEDSQNPEGPSISAQMFSWAKQDLANSKARWNIVTGHAPGYHVGNATDTGNKTYFNNPVIIKFLAGLKDGTGKSMIDAYINGHSHGFSRVLEMAASADGVGVGIPFITTGAGGTSVLNAFNQAPYGSNVLEPQNYLNKFTLKILNPDNTTQSVTATNIDLNFEDQPFPNITNDYDAYLQQLPQDAQPTSVGLSGLFAYSDNNLANGGTYTLTRDDKGKLKTTDPSKQTIIAIQGGEPFSLTNDVFNTLLPGTPSQTGDVSGLYGYGSGAVFAEADAGYFFLNYRTVEPLDPAVTLIGKQQGLTEQQMQRGSLFYAQWSPQTATINDLALFSFKVIFKTDGSDAYLDNLQLVQKGNGYLEQAIGSTTYLDGTYTFEILGNNPVHPLGFDQADPTRAAVDLTFSQGQLTAVAFAKDGQGQERKGSGYRELANSFNQNNKNESTTKSVLVGVNINLEAQTFLADQAPGNDLYQDWYLMADTAITSSAIAQGSFGGLQLNLQPSAARAREILASQPLTTGYSGTGPQASYPNPQQGLLSIRDATGNLLAGSTQTPLQLNQGSTQLLLNQLPAPGNLQVDFGGDATSSYLVNHKAASSSVALQYGSWDAGLSPGTESSLLLSRDLPITIVRSDSLPGTISLGLRQSTAPTPLWLLQNANPASSAALDTTRLFTPSGSGSWLATEAQRQGDSAACRGSLSAGGWIPVARDANGQELAVQSITVSANTAVVQFSGGIQARYGTPSTGTLASSEAASPLVVNIKRLGTQENGLGFYPADPVTGGILLHGRTLLPTDPGYLQGALALAKDDHLLLAPSQLPAYGSETTLIDLPLDPRQNYGLLLLRHNDPNDLSSSFAAANPGGIVTMQTFAAPDRGVIFGVEDLRPGIADFDYNDLSVTLSSSSFQVLNPGTTTMA